MKVSLVLTLSLCVVYVCGTGPIVTTEYGQVEGYTQLNNLNQTVHVFLGIPYARPPVGELRWKKPVPMDSWFGVMQTKAFSDICVQHLRNTKNQSEDCLYLNIFTPSGLDQNSKLPIIFDFYGGGYNTGGTPNTGSTAFGNLYNPHGIIFVNANFRVGPLATFTTGTAAAPGNLNYWDQASALKWVYENIKYFGGDETKITVMGQSAGGTMASNLALSPVTRDYVAKVVAISGTGWAGNAITDNVKSDSRELARAAGCVSQSENDFMACMRSKSIDNLWDALAEIKSALYTNDQFRFTPYYDGEFFPRPLPELVKESKKVPTLAGCGQNEGIYYTVLNKATPSLNIIGIHPSNHTSFTKDKLIDIIRNLVAPVSSFGVNAPMAQQEIIDHYIQDSENTTYQYLLYVYSRINNDVKFEIPMLREIRNKQAAGWPVYLYKMHYFNPSIYPVGFPVTGSTHTNELYYVYGRVAFSAFPMVGDELAVRNTFIDAITSFVKTGVITLSNNVEWLPTSPYNPQRHLQIHAEPFMGYDFDFKQVEFWEQLAKKYGYDVISSGPTATINQRGLGF